MALTREQIEHLEYGIKRPHNSRYRKFLKRCVHKWMRTHHEPTGRMLRRWYHNWEY